MAHYIDGFLLPVPRKYLSDYKRSAEQIAEIWKEYGALSYFEYVGEDLKLDGTRSFTKAVELKDDEVVIFGWVLFPSKEIRNSANRNVPYDPRMADLVGPLTNPNRLVFDAERMVYGGFKSFI